MWPEHAINFYKLHRLWDVLFIDYGIISVIAVFMSIFVIVTIILLTTTFVINLVGKRVPGDDSVIKSQIWKLINVALNMYDYVFSDYVIAGLYAASFFIITSNLINSKKTVYLPKLFAITTIVAIVFSVICGYKRYMLSYVKSVDCNTWRVAIVYALSCLIMSSVLYSGMDGGIGMKGNRWYGALFVFFPSLTSYVIFFAIRTARSSGEGNIR